MRPAYSIVPFELGFCETPEVLDAVNVVVFPIAKFIIMTDAKVFKSI